MFNWSNRDIELFYIDYLQIKGSPAGLYKSTLVIKEDGVTTHQIPVELTVLSFTLPDIPSGKTMLVYSIENINYRYFGQSQIEPGDSDYQNSLLLADRHFQMTHRHKISLVGNPDGYTPVNQMNNAWKDRLNGNLFKPAKGYGGPGVGVGNNIYVIGEYGQWPWMGGTKAQMWSNTDAWVQWFDSAALTTPTEYFLYLIDESDNIAEIEKWSQWINSNPGLGKRLMSMATIDLPKAEKQAPSLDIPTSWASIGITKEWQHLLLYLITRNRHLMIL